MSAVVIPEIVFVPAELGFALKLFARFDITISQIVGEKPKIISVYFETTPIVEHKAKKYSEMLPQAVAKEVICEAGMDLETNLHYDWSEIAYSSDQTPGSAAHQVICAQFNDPRFHE